MPEATVLKMSPDHSSVSSILKPVASEISANKTPRKGNISMAANLKIRNNPLMTSWLTGKEQATYLPVDTEFADENNIDALVKESVENELLTARDKGQITSKTCGNVIFVTNPRTGGEKMVTMKCGNCARCRSEKASEIWRGLVDASASHDGYYIKSCDNNEAERLMSLLHKENLIRLPIGLDRNVMIISRRAAAAKHERTPQAQSVMDFSPEQDIEYIKILAAILGDRPLKKRSSGTLHKNDSSKAYNDFEADGDDLDDFVDPAAAFEQEDYIYGSSEISYYGLGLKSSSEHLSLERIGTVAQLRAVEQTLSWIPENLDEVQEVIDERRKIFTDTVKLIADSLGVKIKVTTITYTAEILPSEISWSEKINRETAVKLRHHMNYFSSHADLLDEKQLQTLNHPPPL